MLLAGDLGGTKTLLGLFRRGDARPEPLHVEVFTTHDHAGLTPMIERFLAQHGGTAPHVEAACVGVAGPVIHGEATLTNVPWRVSATEIGRATGARRVALLNDVEAAAWAIAALAPEDLVEVCAGHADPEGNGLLATVGTGLGQAFLHRIGGRFVPVPSEGGHADFPARNERELAVVRHIIDRFGRADVERIVSGRGLANLADYTHGGRCPHLPDDPDGADVPAHVSRAAQEGHCAACAEAFDIFIDALGSVAGNLAIQAVARGGVYLGGGIPGKILPALTDGRFARAFASKPPMDAVLRAIPVWAIRNPRAGLLGAAVCAAGL